MEFSIFISSLSLNILHITNFHCSTIMITKFFVLGFLDVFTGDAIGFLFSVLILEKK